MSNSDTRAIVATTAVAAWRREAAAKQRARQMEAQRRIYERDVEDNFFACTTQYNMFAYVPTQTLIRRVCLVSPTWRKSSMCHELYRAYQFNLFFMLGEWLLSRPGAPPAHHNILSCLPSISHLFVSFAPITKNARLLAMFTDPALAGRSPKLVELELYATCMRDALSAYEFANNNGAEMAFPYLHSVRTFRTIKDNLYLIARLPNAHNVDVKMTLVDCKITPGRSRNVLFDCRRLRYGRSESTFSLDPPDVTPAELFLDDIDDMTKLRSFALMESRARGRVVFATLLSKLLGITQPLAAICIRISADPNSHVYYSNAQVNYDNVLFAENTDRMIETVTATGPHLHLRQLDLHGWCLPLDEPIESPLCSDEYREFVLSWLVRSFPNLECLYMCTASESTRVWARKLLSRHRTLRVVVLDGLMPITPTTRANEAVASSGVASSAVAFASSSETSSSDAAAAAAASSSSDATTTASSPATATSAASSSAVTGSLSSVTSAATPLSSSVVVANTSTIRYVRGTTVYATPHAEVRTNFIDTDPPTDDLLLTIIEHLHFAQNFAWPRMENNILATLLWRDGEPDAARLPW